MITQSLKRQFGQAVTTNSNEYHQTNVLWLQDEQSKPIGFYKDQLTSREQQLLTLLLPAWKPFPEAITVSEKRWKDWLFLESTKHLEVPTTEPVRFIHFSLGESVDTYADFHEVWQNQLVNLHSILWMDSLHGVVIDTGQDEVNGFRSFVQAIATDFYIDLSLLIGSTVNINEARSRFKWEQACFKAALPHVNAQHIFKEHEAVPYYLTQFIPTSERAYISSNVLTDDVLSDHDMIKSISAYLHHHLNLSSAAKSLHMHRNSLQYRIDKFIERTGIDIKQFQHAAFMHFILLLQDKS
ncbi:helix-turn-helix domain-containing protein [Alkalicoccobacillus murimartini]|uniref:Sugar diacid utilization regulator n=1 Tax=Alkalicoccobacillus murimartini TaxID=171685 RepID=A0ABT9YC51_9BACI|nr:helix-turn-helix domain-containing protein [Alkalicoccobacillus murimartini]MDQ0205299.1 sugar diacid utilization regulator [Alkalicoccobacillus murimartini]